MTSLLGVIQGLASRVRAVEVGQASPPQWATVTQVSPLRVQIDGEDTALSVAPENLAGPVVLAQRVLVQAFGRRVVVFGPPSFTALATPVTAVSRDAAGRSRFTDPLVAADVDTLGARNAAISAATAPLSAADALRPFAVLPSSLAVGSGSASVASDGLITFTGVSYLDVKGVFDGLGGDTYDVYLTSLGSAAANQHLRFLNGSTPLTSASYNRVAVYTQNAAGPTRSSVFGTTELAYVGPGFAYAPQVSARATFFGPKKAGGTGTVWMHSMSAASDRFLWDEYGQGPGGYDGFRLTAVSGAMTGTIRVVKVA